MTDRRQFLTAYASLVGALVAATLRSSALAAEARGEAGTRLNAIFDVFMDERLTKTPEQLTSLGLDKGKYAWAKAKLNDASLAQLHEYKRDRASQLKRLKAFDRSSLTGRDLADYDTVTFQLETIARTEPFEYGDVRGYIVPYVVSQHGWISGHT